MPLCVHGYGGDVNIGRSEVNLRVTGHQRRDLRVAPMRRRVLASMLNALVGILALALTLGGAYAVTSLIGGEEKLQRARPLKRVTGSVWGRLALQLCGFVLGVLLTGRQSPGSRIVGIRLVDARTGGPVSRRQAILRVGVRQAWQALTKRSIAPPVRHKPDEVPDLRSEVEALKREHADDQEAFQLAMMRFHEEHKHELGVSCLPLYRRLLIRLPLAVAIDAPVLWSPLHQGLPDMLAGTVMIVDR